MRNVGLSKDVYEILLELLTDDADTKNQPHVQLILEECKRLDTTNRKLLKEIKRLNANLFTHSKKYQETKKELDQAYLRIKLLEKMD